MSDRVEQLLQAGNAASGRVRGLWVTFILFGTYLIIAIGGTTHRQILLEAPIVLPILGASLDLVDFYRFAPLLFLVYHFYMLVQLLLLARTLRRLNEALVYPLVTPGAADDFRARADLFLITQMLSGGRHGFLPGLFLWLAAWLTMVFAPIVLLLAFQIRFLPYHDVLTTWMQRGVLVTDVALVWLLWPAIASKKGRLGGAVVALLVDQPLAIYRAFRRTYDTAIGHYEAKRYRDYLKSTIAGQAQFQQVWFEFLGTLVLAILVPLLSLAVIGFSLLVATIPAEGIERWVLNHPQVTKNEKGEEITETWPFHFWRLAERNGEADVSVSRLVEGSTWTSKRPRERQVPVQAEPNFVWWPTAILFEGEPDQASSKVTSLFSRNLVLVDDIDLVTLTDKELEAADRTLVLRGRDLRYARFDRADLRKADMFEANLAGAVLVQTRLEKVKLEKAEMQGANLSQAEMQGANLRGAGIWMTISVDADLEWAQVQTPVERMQDPYADEDSAKRAEKAGASIDGWLEAIPEGRVREQARERFTILGDPSRGPPGWRPWAGARNLTSPEDWNEKAEAGLAAFLGDLGCQPDNAPHVARGLLRRVRWDGELGIMRPYGPALAAALLTKGCAGANGLTAEELAKLPDIASDTTWRDTPP